MRQRGFRSFAACFLLICLLAIAGAAGPAAAAQGDCSQPSTTGSSPKAADCLFILRVGVSLETCELCVCDVGGNGAVSASDALACLRIAVGRTDTPANCPACRVTTTTRGPKSSSTTSSSTTTSTTTTLPLPCNNDLQCAAFEEHRCNPNNNLCEKPCKKDTDCKDFFECHRASGYCVPPALDLVAPGSEAPSAGGPATAP
jgi:hypothetical protein